MLKKIRAILTVILGGILGGVFYRGIMVFGDDTYRKAGVLTRDNTDVSYLILFVISFALIANFLIPEITPYTTTLITRDTSRIPIACLISCTVGLIFGLVIALLLSMTYRSLMGGEWYAVVTIGLYGLCGYLGFAVGFGQTKNVEQLQGRLKGDPERFFGIGPWKETPKIFDTSVIIDGRIADVIRAGFLEGPFVVPDFVLAELHHISDSASSIKRNRGRRGLEILNQLREEFKVTVYSSRGKKDIEEIPEVDVKLIKLSRNLKGKLLTTDFNLNRVARINNVAVLNVNDLANAIKPVAIPGEPMLVNIIRRGKTEDQGIGYLDDGTMIVVEDGGNRIGERVPIRVTSVIQTSAGKMIFGRRDTSEEAKRDDTTGTRHENERTMT